jgi:hypothetical protein
MTMPPKLKLPRIAQVEAMMPAASDGIGRPAAFRPSASGEDRMMTAGSGQPDSGKVSGLGETGDEHLSSMSPPEDEAKLDPGTVLADCVSAENTSPLKSVIKQPRQSKKLLEKDPRAEKCYIYAPFAAADLSLRRLNGGAAHQHPDISQEAADRVAAGESSMGGGAGQGFKKIYGSSGGSIILGDQKSRKSARKGVKEANSENSPICLGVTWSTKKPDGSEGSTGNHWIYVSEVRGNLIYAYDQQNSGFHIEIPMNDSGDWIGSRTYPEERGVGNQWTYQVTRVQIAPDVNRPSASGPVEEERFVGPSSRPAAASANSGPTGTIRFPPITTQGRQVYKSSKQQGLEKK